MNYELMLYILYVCYVRVTITNHFLLVNKDQVHIPVIIMVQKDLVTKEYESA